MMRMTNGKTTVAQLLAASTAAAAIVLGGQIVVWATTKCQEPNPSTRYCTALTAPKEVQSCNELDDGAGSCEVVEQKERN